MLPSASRSFLVVALTVLRALAAAVLVMAVLVMALAPTAAAAESPNEVVEDLVDGVYIATNRQGDATPEMFREAIDEATRDGIAMIVVVPRESIPYPEAFALRVRQAAEADIAVLFSEEGQVEASVAEELDDRAIPALDAARAAATPGEAATAYFVNLTEEPDREVPDIVRTITNWVFYLLLVLGVVVFIELGLRRFKNRRIRI